MSTTISREKKIRVPPLAWPARPRRSQHATLGRQLVWATKCGRYRVERFTESPGPPRYYALVWQPTYRPAISTAGFWRHVEHERPSFRSRHAAQKHCQRHALQQPSPTKERRPA